jgi:hypothetical protein
MKIKNSVILFIIMSNLISFNLFPQKPNKSAEKKFDVFEHNGKFWKYTFRYCTESKISFCEQRCRNRRN